MARASNLSFPRMSHLSSTSLIKNARVQEVLGTLLYYAHAIDCTMLPPSVHWPYNKPPPATMATLTAITQLFNYCATNPEATLRGYTAMFGATKV